MQIQTADWRPTRCSSYNSDDDDKTFIIRSANNRFWHRDSGGWIFATGEQAPSESDNADRFKLVQIRENVYSLVSAKDGLYVKWFILSGDNTTVDGYCAMITTPDEFCEVEVSSAEEHALAIPRYVVFKGDNGKYAGQWE